MNTNETCPPISGDARGPMSEAMQVIEEDVPIEELAVEWSSGEHGGLKCLVAKEHDSGVYEHLESLLLQGVHLGYTDDYTVEAVPLCYRVERGISNEEGEQLKDYLRQRRLDQLLPMSLVLSRLKFDKVFQPLEQWDERLNVTVTFARMRGLKRTPIWASEQLSSKFASDGDLDERGDETPLRGVRVALMPRSGSHVALVSLRRLDV